MTKTPVRTFSGVTHAIAYCKDCGWENQCHKNALATGKIHAQTYGHNVRVEQGIVVDYEAHDG